MKIQVIDCSYLFIDCLIDEIKLAIKSYHQGFMIVDNKLYLPYYQVLQRKYSLPDNYETTSIDLRDVSSYDSLARYFYKVDALDIDDIIDLYNDWLDNEFEKVLNTADEIAQAKYDLGYEDGCDECNNNCSKGLPDNWKLLYE